MTALNCGAASLMLAGVAAVVGCHNRQEPAAARAPGADSLVLERMICFGTCPAYRLKIGGDGAVTFISRNPGDTSGTKTDSITPSQVEWLVGEAKRLGFYSLPTVIADDSTLCPLRATDHPTATLTIFRRDSTHTVVDYHGCYAGHDLGTAPRIERLRRLEAAVDSVAGSSRWVRPASR